MYDKPSVFYYRHVQSKQKKTLSIFDTLLSPFLGFQYFWIHIIIMHSTCFLFMLSVYLWTHCFPICVICGFQKYIKAIIWLQISRTKYFKTTTNLHSIVN